jgi:hypothetical protein
MANTIIAHPAHETTTEPKPPYVLRGHGMFELYRDELQYLGGGRWLIPSGSKEGLTYEVRVSTTTTAHTLSVPGSPTRRARSATGAESVSTGRSLQRSWRMTSS